MAGEDPGELPEADVVDQRPGVGGDAARSDAAATWAGAARNAPPELSRDPGTSPGGQDQDASARAGEDDDLRHSLTALSQLSTRSLGLESLLTRVATFAVRAIPGAEGAGLTLMEEARQDTVVTTAEFVAEVDQIQYAIGQGPCISAAAEGRTVISGSLGADPRWPRFGGRIARLGVHSVISLPLVTSEGVVGAMNVYAHDKQVFADWAAELGELFAVPAAIAVQNAHVLAQAQRLAARLQTALDTRSVVERAVGIMISRSGGTAEEALERLRSMSQHEHQRLPVLAQQIVDEAARRARGRRHSN